MKTYTIKPLEWSQSCVGAFSTIAPFFGVMTVTNIGAHGWKVYIGATLIESCLDTLEDAQAAAESWHRERIESALIVKGE